MAAHNEHLPAHLRWQTQFSRTGALNMANRKPYRTRAQKAQARAMAVKCEDGTWRSNAPVSYHS